MGIVTVQKVYLINPSNHETLLYRPLNIQIHARLPAQGTAPQMFESIQSTYQATLL